jgi:hypothetical protein
MRINAAKLRVEPAEPVELILALERGATQGLEDYRCMLRIIVEYANWAIIFASCSGLRQQYQSLESIRLWRCAETT